MKKEKSPAQFTKPTKRTLRYTFNNAELLQIGKEMAESSIALAAVEQDKKRIVADFSAKIATKESEVTVASNKIQSGYEFREIPCTITFHKPKAGRKEVVRDDTKELVATEDMTPDEMQQELIPQTEGA